jgi:chromosome segregation ATPase
MPRTNLQRNIERGRRANELAAVAQCMDGWLRNHNDNLEREVISLQQEVKNLQRTVEIAISKILRRDDRINELEMGWQDLANTLHDALEDLESYRIINRNLTEQILDCTCKESDIETETLNSQ